VDAQRSAVGQARSNHPVLCDESFLGFRANRRQHCCAPACRSRCCQCRPMIQGWATTSSAACCSTSHSRRSATSPATDHRDGPFPVPLWHTGGAKDPTGRTAAGRRPCDTGLPVVLSLHLGDRPGPARQAAMVGKSPAHRCPGCLGHVEWHIHGPAWRPGGSSSASADDPARPS
jgi:hypothetical protein